MNNKKKYCQLVFIGSLMMFWACDDFITKAPLDQTNVEISYQTPEDANRAVMGIYNRFDGTYAQNMSRLTELTTDNGISQEDRLKGAGEGFVRELNDFSFSSENNFIANRWSDLYNGISRANLLLNRIESIEFPNNELKNQYIGESKFLRALMYFDLVRFYGGVPISLSVLDSIDEAYALVRSPESEVYNAIVADLQDAINNLPTSYNQSNLGRATEGAAKGLLAKVYLTMGSPDLALPLLREIINSSQYRLMDGFNEVFDNDNTPESLFEIQYTSSESAAGNPYPNWFLPTDANAGPDVFGADWRGVGGGFSGTVLATQDLYDTYEENDTRRDYTIAEFFSNVDGMTVLRVDKYKGAPASQLNSDDNLIILRYADVLLMLAEAINESNGGPTAEAYDAVDKVRTRAGVGTWERTLNYESFKTKLLEERRKEFAFENHRWFDLKRFGKTIDILTEKGYNIQPHHLLFPLPQLEVELNPNLEQNPGY
jgi:starch-binding outer membrane protein, SusD/RagB family